MLDFIKIADELNLRLRGLFIEYQDQSVKSLRVNKNTESLLLMNYHEKTSKFPNKCRSVVVVINQMIKMQL